MEEKQIKKILKENKKYFDALEEYDKTGKLPKLNKNQQKKFDECEKNLSG